MAQARYRHSAVSLPDGRVLVLGGYRPRDDRQLTSVEIYDPETGTFTTNGQLVEGRGDARLVLLADGRILVVAGRFYDSNGDFTIRRSVEIYDPATGQSRLIGSLAERRHSPVVALLGDGRVLVAGGWSGSEALRTAEVIDPRTGAFSPVAPMATPRAWPAGALLQDGRVLIVVGSDGAVDLDTAEVFVPATVSGNAPP